MLAAAIRASLIEADEQHANSSAKNNDPQHEMRGQLGSSSSAQSERHHTTGQKQPTNSVESGKRQQVDEQESDSLRQPGQSPFGASQSICSSGSKPPRNSMSNSRSAAAFYNLDQEPDLPAEPQRCALPAGPHQQALPDGLSPPDGHQQQAQLGTVTDHLHNMGLQAGSNGLSGQSNSNQLFSQHAMHQSQSQPSLGKSQDTAHASQYVQHHSLGKRHDEQQEQEEGRVVPQEGQQGGQQEDRQGSAGHRDTDNQRSPRSASQLSGK